MSGVSKVADWLQIVSNVGIVVGLALVGMQMKQASDIAAAELASERLRNTIDSFSLLAGEEAPAAWARAQMNAADLTDTELSVVKYYLLRQWALSARNDIVNDAGFGTSSRNEDEVQGWVNTLGNETALRWWATEHGQGRALSLTPELRDAVDARLREAGSPQREAHPRLLEEMRSGPLPFESASKQP